MLRFNDRTLVSMATCATRPADKEGFLLRKGERASQGSQRRWFMLRGNLLFFFRDRDTSKEPLGCIVLERVAVVPHMHATEFSLEFDCPDARPCELAVERAEERAEWIAVLKEASYERKLEMLLQLEARLSQLTGKSPLEGSSFLQRPVSSFESRSQAVRRHTEIKANVPVWGYLPTGDTGALPRALHRNGQPTPIQQPTPAIIVWMLSPCVDVLIWNGILIQTLLASAQHGA